MGPSDKGKLANVYKSEKRMELEDEGYVIHGCSGDQWSDLLGFADAMRSFKLPMYLLAYILLIRYKLAERNLLEVMKSKEAIFNSLILRPELRMEPRKRIGDTGLLDHLLKLVSGRLAPGGAERFRRRHNVDGAMEYRLESDDLIKVRKKAGVKDPYWNPPPGWTPGDCPSQDPICAKALRLLKDENAKIKR